MTDQNSPLPDAATIQSPQLSKLSEIRHAFFTRKGGCSSGIYQSLNAGQGSNDNPQSVRENRSRMATHMGVGVENLVTPYQIHSNTVVVADEPWGDNRPKADAVVTTKRNIAIGVVTADCGPVLFADQSAGIIAAAHAGWQGALSGILDNTIKTMVALGANADNIVAVLGPSITQSNYEVGPEFPQKFLDQDSDHQRYFVPSDKDGHWMFDLCQYSLDRLKACGVNATFTGQCTYRGEEHYFSYRRTTHRKEADYGRQLSAIALI